MEQTRILGQEGDQRRVDKAERRGKTVGSRVYSLAQNSAVVNPVRTDNMKSLAPKPAANTARPVAER